MAQERRCLGLQVSLAAANVVVHSGLPASLQGAAACPNVTLLMRRRRAYRRMAELLGGRPLQHYDEVFRHEGPESKHINQELTPVIEPKHAVIVN